MGLVHMKWTKSVVLRGDLDVTHIYTYFDPYSMVAGSEDLGQ